jgi:hypothetical protein
MIGIVELFLLVVPSNVRSDVNSARGRASYSMGRLRRIPLLDTGVRQYDGVF